MPDDIVTRLRDDYGFIWQRFGASVPSVMQAADEIEMLRRELALALGRTCRCVNTGAANES